MFGLNGVGLAFTLIGTAAASYVFTMAIRGLARRFGVIDHPENADRKHHQQATPLLGGVAVIAAVLFGIMLAQPQLLGGFVLPKHLLGISFASVILAIGGAIDDRFNLRPWQQILFPISAAFIIVAAGIGVSTITNPFGGVIGLDHYAITIITVADTPYRFLPIADGLTIIWLLGMMYTTKFLDGVDGLVSGITVIGAVVMAALSLTTVVFQPETAQLALVVAVAFAGFLVFNWPPASIFLGEGGSVFAGFMLGVLAIIAGSKIATTLLVFAIPVLDVAAVIVQRVIRRRSPFSGDRTHFHLRLVDAGFSTRQAVLILYALTAVFGLAGLVLDSSQKVWALLLAALTLVLLAWLVIRKGRQHS